MGVIPTSAEGWSARLGERLFERFERARENGLACRYSPALRRLAEQVRSFAREVESFVEAADAAPEQQRCVEFAREVLCRAARAGWLTRFLPSWVGGRARIAAFRERSSLAMLVFVEELGAVSPGLATLLAAHYLGAMPILLSFDFAAQRRILRPLCADLEAGQPSICAFAITEPEAGSDVEDAIGGTHARLRTTARRVPGGYLLTGRKCFISGGNLAKVTAVFAALEPEKNLRAWTCFAVPMDAPGVKILHVEDKMGQRRSPAAELSFDEVFVPEGLRVGPERGGWRLNRATLDMSRPLVGGLALGAVRTVIHEALAWAEKNRLTTDRFFQHEIARLLGSYAAAHALVVRAAEVVPPVADLSAMAKFIATDTAMMIASQVLEWMGLEATVRGCHVERLYRDIRLTQIYEGTNEINRLAVFEGGQPQSWLHWV